MEKTILRAKLEVCRNRHSQLLRKKTKPYSPERFKKKRMLKELDVKIKEIEERL